MKTFMEHASHMAEVMEKDRKRMTDAAQVEFIESARAIADLVLPMYRQPIGTERQDQVIRFSRALHRLDKMEGQERETK